MTPHRLPTLQAITLAALLAIVMSTGHLWDGPSELEAAQAVAESTQDAIESVAANAALARANARFCHQPNPTTITDGESACAPMTTLVASK